MKKSKTEDKMQKLRERAEKKKRDGGAETRDFTLMTPDEIACLVHELETHQIELELQNEDLRLTQEALVETRDRYTELYDFAPVGYVALGEKGLILHSNLTLADMLDISRAHLINQPLSSYIVKEDQDAYYLYLRRMQETLKKHSCELRLRPQNGKPLWVRLDSDIVESPCDDGCCIIMAVTDINSLKKAEAALIERDRLNTLLLDSFPHPAMLIRKDRIILAANKSAIKSGAQVGKYCWKTFGSSIKLNNEESTDKLRDSHCAFCMQDAALQSGQLQNVRDVRVGDKIYDTYWIPLDQDMLLHYAVDVTERKELEEQLRQSVKMQAIGLLAGGIAHDFNNQLAAIMGYAELLLTRIKDPDLLEYAKIILLVANRSKDLTQQLLAFARKGQYHVTCVNLHEVISEVVNMVTHSFDKNIVIDQHFNASRYKIEGDRTQIQNAILNIVLNARDVMPDGGTIILTTDTTFLDEKYCKENNNEIIPGHYIKLSINDNGTGMSKEIQSRIFEPFFTTKEVGKGTGMGLASVYGTMKLQKGIITVNSEPDKGTTFNLYFPLSEKTMQEPTHRNKLIVSKITKTILLIDDEELILAVSKALLENIGLKVIVERTGEGAIDYYKANWEKIDLVIVDMTMPNMGGREVFAEMKKINPEVRCLLSSGYSIDGKAQKILSDGAIDFIQKPYTFSELSNKINKIFNSLT